MLNGQTVLIVEAEFLVALDIQLMLESIMAGEMLFARSPLEAHDHQQHWHSVGLAIVELGHDSAQTEVLLSALQQAGITLILSTTENAWRKGHPAFPGAPVLVKPMVEEDFHRAISQALGSSAKTSDYGS